MKNEFGKLNGIPVYKVSSFDSKLALQGAIQLVDDGDRFWKICTTNSFAKGMYDSFSGHTSIYDQEDFNQDMKILWAVKERYEKEKEKAEVKPAPTPKTEPIFEDEESLMGINNIVDEIMSKAQDTCEALLSLTDVLVGQV